MQVVAMLILAAMASVSQSKAAPQPDLKIITFRDAAGTLRRYMEPQRKPYREGDTMGSRAVRREPPVLDSDGRVISAIGFFGWDDSGAIRLRIFKWIPASGAPNEFLFKSPDLFGRLQPKELEAYTLEFGKMVQLKQLTALGFEYTQARLERGIPSK